MKTKPIVTHQTPAKVEPEARSLLERVEALESSFRGAQAQWEENAKILREAIAATTQELRQLERVVGN